MRVKKTIYLDPHDLKRLEHHAVEAGIDSSAFVRNLIREHCRSVVVSVRGKPPAPAILDDPAPVAA